MNSGKLNQRNLFPIFVLVILVAFIFTFFLGGFSARFNLTHYTFLFLPGDRFNDLINILRFDVLSPYTNPIANYLPLSYFLIFPLKFVKSSLAVLIYLTIFFSFLSWYCWYFLAEYRQSVSKVEFGISLLIFIGLSYPALFVIDRANLEAWIFIFLA
ncbi:MAG: hypothetical protein K5Q00_06320, partial [Gammaproteobacteria bacterium]|nr:hypothetical protein [Gammaproteobacteria bacterium]